MAKISHWKKGPETKKKSPHKKWKKTVDNSGQPPNPIVKMKRGRRDTQERSLGEAAGWFSGSGWEKGTAKFLGKKQ